VSSVRDSGIGVKAEDIPNLFVAYQQLDMKANRQIEGTGLGLAITRRLAEMMGGEVTVESEYGKGSTFTVRMLQKLVSGTPIGEKVAESLMSMRYTISRRATQAKQARINLSYAHVLVVDDVATNLDVIKGMLKPYHIRIDCASSGQQAIDMIRGENTRYNAVFMDHMMPFMDGIEAVRIIREEIGTEYAEKIPIIALTANAIIGNEELFLQNGFQAFISKPIDIVRLDNVLRQWVMEGNTGTQEADMDEPGAGLDENDESPLWDMIMSGLDIEMGLERFGYDEDIYVQVLLSYAENTVPLLQNMAGCLEAGSLEEYAIAVHGLKGSSYGVCANEVGKAAEALELAAKAGEMEAVAAGHGLLVEMAEELAATIAEKLGSPVFAAIV
jgi:CheY-like chemotaxis protein